ncbi:response regulator transcription factor [Falsiroseomonas sp. HC035]|uniref:response regulator transcription factor n=1 Tax=Falsiroseomonas sp. HC035 TaxID=3390999 RepID=UPI003D31677B
MLSVLLVSGDQRLRASLADSLAQSFTVQQAEDAAAARVLLSGSGVDCDAVLIDTGMSPAEGPDLCASLRASGVDLPIVLLSEAGDAQDIVRGLNSGANDYIVKPFSLPELAARLRAHHRVHASAGTAVRTIGPYAFRPSAKLLLERARNRTIRLTAKEVAVLKYLHEADGQPVAKQTLLMDVWGYNNAVSSHTLETHIWRLRQKIEPNPANARLLLSNRDGYRLNQAA